jgi:hypothetical protein
MSSTKRRMIPMAMVAAVAVVIAAGCAPPPQVGAVPGTYTFRQSIINVQPDGQPGYGGVGGSAIICIDQASALELALTASSGNGYQGTVHLDFGGGSVYDQELSITGPPWVTAVVGPGCFTLHFVQTVMHIDDSGLSTSTLTVTFA